ncbi:hypothetical protein QJS10_CPB18g01236 [Acorus calamus]|uniref:Uncharacterized protein n=1 Tax=Acorus calamus TaxID=4465 RepID=A0AAV9CPV1_ACOCL|nr:hypothetical protein QJS10_CPB18g01236 [Acorus calamus]
MLKGSDVMGNNGVKNMVYGQELVLGSHGQSSMAHPYWSSEHRDYGMDPQLRSVLHRYVLLFMGNSDKEYRGAILSDSLRKAHPYLQDNYNTITKFNA